MTTYLTDPNRPSTLPRLGKYSNVVIRTTPNTPTYQLGQPRTPISGFFPAAARTQTATGRGGRAARKRRRSRRAGRTAASRAVRTLLRREAGASATLAPPPAAGPSPPMAPACRERARGVSGWGGGAAGLGGVAGAYQARKAVPVQWHGPAVDCRPRAGSRTLPYNGRRGRPEPQGTVECGLGRVPEGHSWWPTYATEACEPCGPSSRAAG